MKAACCLRRNAQKAAFAAARRAGKVQGRFGKAIKNAGFHVPG